jgi:GLPGLI family protein
MKKINIALLIFLIPTFGLTQSGYVTYIQYEGEKPTIVSMYFDKTQSLYIYNIGKKGRIHKAANGEVIDFDNDEKFAQQLAKYGTFYEYNSDEEGQLVYMNWQSNSLIFRDIFRNDACIVKEPILPKFKWVLRKDFKKIGKYSCQKAVAKIRGRNYEAWFTTEIPIPTGPWKLHGLPGLILEATDDSKKYRYIFQSIDMPLKDKDVLTKLPTKGKVINLKEYPNFLKLQDENYKREIESKAAERGEKVIVTLSKEPKQEIEYEQ